MSEEALARAELVTEYRRAAGLKLNELASGNISRRFAGGMLISKSGASAENITEDSVVLVGAGWRMERAAFAVFRVADACGHLSRISSRRTLSSTAHSDYCVAVACQNIGRCPVFTT